MDDLLTTRQLQELLQVDRITIYRMLNDGRLRGFKVGGQWRFSQREIEAWLQSKQESQELAGTLGRLPMELRPSTETLPLSCVEAIQDLCAEALGVAAVTTDLGGVPITGVSNSCDYCTLILSTHKGRRLCGETWSQDAGGDLQLCHAGLLCTNALVEVHATQVAIISSCQFVERISNGPWQARVPAVADTVGLAETELRATMDSVRSVPGSTLSRVPELVRKMAGTFSEIGEERLSLLDRLQNISKMSKI